VREGAADDHLLARCAADGELRVIRHPTADAHDAADERLAPVVTADDGDPVAAAQPRLCRSGSTVDEEAPGDRARAQHLPVHVEDVTSARV
jgi:hypothetical protein